MATSDERIIDIAMKYGYDSPDSITKAFHDFMVLRLPLHYLDMIWHRPDKTNITCEEFDAKLTDILKTDEWIIDGNYGRTLEMRLKSCDTVFLLEYPLDVCLAGAKKRVGENCEEMPWIEEELDEEFRQ